jgi:hypothetical protein
MELPMRISVLALVALAGGIAAANAVVDTSWRPIFAGGKAQPHDYPFQTGSAATAGREAVYFRKAAGSDLRYAGVLQRQIPVEAWRGKRVRLTLPVKVEGDGLAHTWAWVGKSNDIYLRAQPQAVAPGGAWQPHQYVLDVPQDAVNLVVDMRLSGKSSTLWADDVKVEAVNDDVALTRTTRMDPDGVVDGGGGGGGPAYNPPR